MLEFICSQYKNKWNEQVILSFLNNVLEMLLNDIIIILLLTLV